MATRLNWSHTVTASGVVNPGSVGSPLLSKAPEGGFTFSCGITGTNTATVELWVWLNSSYKEKAGTINLPVVGTDKNGDYKDFIIVDSYWENLEINVTAISAGTLTLAISGLGV